MCLILVGPHLAVAREDFSTYGACCWLGEVNVSFVEVETFLASELDSTNITVVEELLSGSVGKF